MASSHIAPPTSRSRKMIKTTASRPKPARVQLDQALLTNQTPPQNGIAFNIWHSQWSGGDHIHTTEPAKGRCNIARDAGYTQGDKIMGSHICLFFARGLCHRGYNCQYLHRLPNSFDHFPSNEDCFGRNTFADYRDDHGGVGSFMRVNRTLYVGGIHASDDAEEVVARHFQEWGPIQCTRVPGAGNRGIAFVTYNTEAHAQFAKEAMAHQCLDHNEILNLRWSRSDPNPLTRARQERELEEQATDAVRAAVATWPDSSRMSMEIESLEARNMEERKGLEHNRTSEEVEGSEESDRRNIFPSSTLQALNNFGGNVSTLPLRPGTKRKLVDYKSDEEEDE